MTTDSNLFSSTFRLTEINDLKYDRVARLFGSTDDGSTILTLDVNSELFPCTVGDKLQLLLASTLSLDGSRDDGKGWRDVGRGEASLADGFDYVCHGKLYQFDAENDKRIKAYVSFGGLLLLLDGPFSSLSSLKHDYLYLCLKK